MPDRECKLASVFRRCLPQEVEVKAFRRRVCLADLQAVHRGGLIDARALDQHWETVFEILDPEVHNVVKVARARILNDKGANVTLKERACHLLVESDRTIFWRLQIAIEDAPAVFVRTSHVLQLNYIEIVRANRRPRTTLHVFHPRAAVAGLVVASRAPEVLILDALLAKLGVFRLLLL